jgi:hypothetical protein
MNSYVLWKLDPSLRPGRLAPQAERRKREKEAWIRRSDTYSVGATGLSRRRHA